ncbi:MAG: glycosyltransferase [Pseudomonadota bacterium]
MPFESLDDLAALIPELLVDGERRARIRAAGQRWVQTYFTGDYFWAGLLRQLFG